MNKNIFWHNKIKAIMYVCKKLNKIIILTILFLTINFLIIVWKYLSLRICCRYIECDLTITLLIVIGTIYKS